MVEAAAAAAASPVAVGLAMARGLARESEREGVRGSDREEGNHSCSGGGRQRQRDSGASM